MRDASVFGMGQVGQDEFEVLLDRLRPVPRLKERA
jgi:hypothetical protein